MLPLIFFLAIDSIKVNVSQYKLEVYEGRKVKSYEVCVGKPKTKTPLGKFKILSKENWGGVYSGTF